MLKHCSTVKYESKTEEIKQKAHVVFSLNQLLVLGSLGTIKLSKYSMLANILYTVNCCVFFNFSQLKPLLDNNDIEIVQTAKSCS